MKGNVLVFKRRDPMGWGEWLREMVWPRGGLKRATQYVIHRMRRLPDSPERVGRGLFIGSLIGFLPLPGMQFIGAWLGAKLVNGNLLAALLGTLNTNPITTPFFAMGSLKLGHWMLGIEKPLTFQYVTSGFTNAGRDLWQNIRALFSADVDPAGWAGLAQFWHEIYLPFFIGAFVPGLILSAIGYYICVILVRAYQKARAARRLASGREKPHDDAREGP